MTTAAAPAGADRDAELDLEDWGLELATATALDSGALGNRVSYPCGGAR